MRNPKTYRQARRLKARDLSKQLNISFHEVWGIMQEEDLDAFTAPTPLSLSSSPKKPKGVPYKDRPFIPTGKTWK